jgi:hypothetical protein
VTEPKSVAPESARRSRETQRGIFRSDGPPGQLISEISSALLKFFLRGVRQLEVLREFALVADVAKLPHGTEIELEVPQRRLRVIHVVHGGRAHPTGVPPTAPRADLDLQLRVDNMAPASIDLRLNIRVGAPSLSAGGEQGHLKPPPTTPEPIIDSDEAQRLVLGIVPLKSIEQVLAIVRVRPPNDTKPGRYPLPIAQVTGVQPVGGVTLIARIV